MPTSSSCNSIPIDGIGRLTTPLGPILKPHFSINLLNQPMMLNSCILIKTHKPKIPPKKRSVFATKDDDVGNGMDGNPIPTRHLGPKLQKEEEEEEEEEEESCWWHETLNWLASLYPLYVTVGGAVALVKPSVFSFMVEASPASYRYSLGFIMLAMGLTLQLKDLLAVFFNKPFTILFGCLAQYSIMPAFGAIISKYFGLSPELSVGLILLSCCPGGTASNVVTLIAQGDVPLSVVMTICTTLGAVIFTPLLTKMLAGTYICIEASKLSISTLQVVVAPVLLGSCLQTVFPDLVKLILPFAPFLAVIVSSTLASSVFSENIAGFNLPSLSELATFDLSRIWQVGADIPAEIRLLVLSVVLLHFAGFLVGYLVAFVCGFRERQRRAISIEVGMQNSSLGVVLATSHFPSQVVALPPALSAIIMNIMGSTLGLFWSYNKPNEKDKP